MKQTGMLVVSLRGVKETQNFGKRNRSQIFFLTCFIYRIASVIQPSASAAFVNINQFSILPSAKETMHEHDEELEIYDNAFKNYFQIKAFDDYVFISLKLIACHICLF